VTAWQATVGWHRGATLGETARFGLLVFQISSLVQLALLLFFSSLSAASAITQEKDRRTFILLLLTDLRNYEIVLGKLLGSLMQIAMLLAGTIPLFALGLLLGGVGPHQVIQSVVVLAATAFAAGSLGGLVALWREKTFQALALTVLFLVLYLCLVHGLSILPYLTDRVSLNTVRTAQTWLEPFLALQAVLEPPIEAENLPAAYGFALAMLVLGTMLNLWGMLCLRIWNPSGEPIMQRERKEDTEDDEKERARAHAAPGELRAVWGNPILWREIMTRAYGRRPVLVKLAYFVVLTLVCWFALAPLWGGEVRYAFAAAYGLIPVGVLSLLLVAAQAVTAITSERDTGALDLLLVTDLSPNEFIFGKLGGIVWNTKEYLLPPLILTAIYAWHGFMATPPRGHPELLGYKNIESLVAVSSALIVLLAFATVLGIHVALRTPTTHLAVANTLGTVFFLSLGTMICVALILINGRFEYQWTSFVLFLTAGIGGLWWVLSADRPSPALSIASFSCPLAMFYTIVNILIARPGTDESTDPLLPFLVTVSVFGFTLAAMLVPLLSEFDVALGRTTRGQE
jgi:ABC-type transport system involved in multi-copper enzyme maturation permease subunit